MQTGDKTEIEDILLAKQQTASWDKIESTNNYKLNQPLNAGNIVKTVISPKLKIWFLISVSSFLPVIGHILDRAVDSIKVLKETDQLVHSAAIAMLFFRLR